MKKILFGFLTMLVVVGCATKAAVVSTTPVDNVVSVESSVVVGNEDSKLIGGWAPVFFTKYDQTQLLDIADKMKVGTVKKVIVSYPKKMQSLAAQIQGYLQKNTSQKVAMNSLDLKDNDQVSYNMNQVIVTLYF